MNSKAMRPCPTCGTPSYVNCADELDRVDLGCSTPNEAIMRGVAALEHGLPSLLRNDIQATYELVEDVFRAVLGQLIPKP